MVSAKKGLKYPFLSGAGRCELRSHGQRCAGRGEQGQGLGLGRRWRGVPLLPPPDLQPLTQGSVLLQNKGRSVKTPCSPPCSVQAVLGELPRLTKGRLPSSPFSPKSPFYYMFSFGSGNAFYFLTSSRSPARCSARGGSGQDMGFEHLSNVRNLFTVNIAQRRCLVPRIKI